MAVQHAATACAHPCSASPNAMQFCVYWDVEPRYVDVTEDCLGAGARTAFAWTAHLAENSLRLGRTAVGGVVAHARCARQLAYASVLAGCTC